MGDIDRSAGQMRTPFVLERRRADGDGAGDALACAVCGTGDARLLSYTRLLDGRRIVVCGSHKVAHRRAERLARSTEELVQMIGERRKQA